MNRSSDHELWLRGSNSQEILDKLLPVMRASSSSKMNVVTHLYFDKEDRPSIVNDDVLEALGDFVKERIAAAAAASSSTSTSMDAEGKNSDSPATITFQHSWNVVEDNSLQKKNDGKEDDEDEYVNEHKIISLEDGTFVTVVSWAHYEKRIAGWSTVWSNVMASISAHCNLDQKDAVWELEGLGKSNMGGTDPVTNSSCISGCDDIRLVQKTQ